MGYLPIGLASSALKLAPPFSSGSTTSKTQVRRIGPFPHIVRSNGYATTVSWTDPTTWLCEDTIHSVMAEVRPPLSHLRGVASWPRPPSVGRRPGRGLAARAPWVRARGFSRHDLPRNILRASRHVFSYVTCVCIPHLQLVGRGLVSQLFHAGWRLARDLVAPPLMTGARCCCAFFGLIHSYGMYMFAPQPRGVHYEACVYFVFQCAGREFAGSARIRGPRLAAAGAGPHGVAHILTDKGWGYNSMVPSCPWVGRLSRYLRAWPLSS